MKKKFIKGTAAALAAASCMAVGAIGASSLQSISAYLNYGITVKYNGQEQQMYDANGQRVYPISYNGTTYVPIRAVGNMRGIDVAWDGANNAVLLGKTGMALDFIESFTPYAYTALYASDNKHVTNKDGEIFKLGNTTYTQYIKLRTYNDTEFSFYYDIGGKYTTFTFDVYGDKKDAYLRLYGDNDELIAFFEVKSGTLPTTYTVSVEGVQQLRIVATNASGGYGGVYILNATIE